MADKIDKSLTQGPRGSVNIPGDEQVEEAIQQEVAIEESKKRTRRNRRSRRRISYS